MARIELSSLCYMFVIIAAITSLRWHQCSSLHIELSHARTTETVDSSVNVSCVLDAVDTNEILLMEITKDNDPPIVLIREHEEPSLGSGISRRFQGQGFLDSAVSGSYLNLTVFYPQSDDGGVYQCTMYYLPTSGILTEKSVKGTLVVDNHNITDVYVKIQIMETQMVTILDKLSQVNDTKCKDFLDAENLLDRVTSLEKETAKNAKKESALNARILSLENDMKDIMSNEMDHMKNEIASVKKYIRDMSDEIIHLKKDNKDLSVEVIHLKKDNKIMSDEIVNLKKDNTNVSNELVGMRKDNRDMSDEIIHLKTETKNISDELLSVKKDNDDKSNEIDHFRKETNGLSDEIVSLKKDKKDMSADIVYLKTDNKNIRDEIVSLKKDNTKMSDEIKNFNKVNKDMSTEIIHLKNDNKDLSDTIVSLMKDKNDLSGIIVGLQKDTTDLSDEVDDLSDEEHELKY